MKLYRVNLKGFGYSNCVVYGSSYVVAEDSHKAYLKVRKYLDDKGYGFKKEREMKSVDLIADEDEYTDVQTRLFL